MQPYDPEELRTMSARILRAAGASAHEAAVVAEELIEASLMGLDSHGLVRLAQYVRQIGSGSIRPGQAPQVIKETATTAIVDGGMNFGMVTARYMTEKVMEKAGNHHVAAAVSRHTHHVGRLGSYVQRLAEAGFIGLAFASASRQGHYVTPFGGTRGRLGTNPLAYGCPTNQEPIVFDMSTSMIAEGSIRIAMQRGEELPSNCLLDPQGRPTADPNDFYRDQWGAILPFGGEQGYKGFGLALFVELMGATLAGVSSASEDQPESYINGFCVYAIDPDGFCGPKTFRELADELGQYICSSPPSTNEKAILLPGQREWQTRRQRLAHGIPIANGTWDQLMSAASTVGCSYEVEQILKASATMSDGEVDAGGRSA